MLWARDATGTIEEARAESLPPDIKRVLWARSLRAFGDGYVAILLPLHLSRLGYDAFGVGVISTATLLGSALLTLAVGLVAYRIPRRRALLAAGFLMAATGLGFAGIEGFWPLLVITFVGTLNPSGGIEGRSIGINVSVGIARAPECGDGEALLRAADEASYEAKRAGKGLYRLASPSRHWPLTA